MNPASIDADLALRLFETLLRAVIWVIAAIFAGELLCIAVLCCGKRKSRATADGIFDIS